jgi:predicted nuclease of restriction endonuclease-like (RecB) superfamily
MGKARKIKPSKKVSIRGKHKSRKMACMIPWESTLERDYLKLAEFDPTINYISAQPIPIYYYYGGKERVYFPDFLVKTIDFQTYLIEVKPENKIKTSENLIKFQVGSLYCKENNMRYRVVSEKDIRKGHLIENLDLITDARVEYTDRIVMREIINELSKQTSNIQIGEIKKRINIEESLFYLNLYYLIYSQQIKVDLFIAPLNDNTFILI